MKSKIFFSLLFIYFCFILIAESSDLPEIPAEDTPCLSISAAARNYRAAHFWILQNYERIIHFGRQHDRHIQVLIYSTCLFLASTLHFNSSDLNSFSGFQTKIDTHKFSENCHNISVYTTNTYTNAPNSSSFTTGNQSSTETSSTTTTTTLSTTAVTNITANTSGTITTRNTTLTTADASSVNCFNKTTPALCTLGSVMIRDVWTGVDTVFRSIFLLSLMSLSIISGVMCDYIGHRKSAMISLGLLGLFWYLFMTMPSWVPGIHNKFFYPLLAAAFIPLISSFLSVTELYKRGQVVVIALLFTAFSYSYLGPMFINSLFQHSGYGSSGFWIYGSFYTVFSIGLPSLAVGFLMPVNKIGVLESTNEDSRTFLNKLDRLRMNLMIDQPLIRVINHKEFILAVLLFGFTLLRYEIFGKVSGKLLNSCVATHVSAYCMFFQFIPAIVLSFFARNMSPTVSIGINHFVLVAAYFLLAYDEFVTSILALILFTVFGSYFFTGFVYYLKVKFPARYFAQLLGCMITFGATLSYAIVTPLVFGVMNNSINPHTLIVIFGVLGVIESLLVLFIDFSEVKRAPPTDIMPDSFLDAIELQPINREGEIEVIDIPVIASDELVRSGV